MPHPAIDRTNQFNGNWRAWFRDPSGGGWHDYTTSSSANVSVSRYARPASTNNPKGPLGRDDAGWFARGGHSTSRTVEVERQDHEGYIEYRYVGEVTAPAGSAASVGVIPDISTNLAATTMREALAQFTERSTQFGAAAREAGSTFRMVGNAATGMSQGLDDLMNREWKKIGRMASWKKLPSAYLEYLYGWKPVCDDISNAFDQLLPNLKEHGFDLSLRKTKRLREELIQHRTLFDGTINAEIKWLIRQECRAVMRFALPDWYFDELPTVSPFGTLYETTRASFVVDWFIPIGSWISAFESAQLWPFFRGGTLSTKKTRHVLSFRVTNPDNLYRLTQGPIRNSHDDYSYERAVVTELSQGIILARPSFRDPLSLSHAAQGLSLLTQVFRKWQ